MSKLPSTRFPFLNLSKALDRGQKIFAADKGGKGLLSPVAFSAWGYSDKSSGGFQTVGALRGYGILAAEGSKEEKVLRLTEDARLYFNTEIEDDRRRLRSQFAARPPLFAHLLERWENGTVDDAVARTILKTEIGLNDQSARAALGIYKDNLSFAPPMGSSKASELNEPNGDDADAADEEVKEDNAQHAHKVRHQPLAAPADGPGLNVTRTAEGYIIHLTGTVLTQAHAEEVITLLTALKASLRTATPNGEAAIPS